MSILRIRSRWRPVSSLPLLVILRRLGYAKEHRAGGVYIVNTRLPNDGGHTALQCSLTQVNNLLKSLLKLFFPLVHERTVVFDK